MTGYHLANLPRHETAVVSLVDWARLARPEAQRLRELGFDEGSEVEVLHRASIGGGPVACRVGRMTVAIRRSVASMIHVDLPLAAE